MDPSQKLIDYCYWITIQLLSTFLLSFCLSFSLMKKCYVYWHWQHIVDQNEMILHEMKCVDLTCKHEM
ncbi:hypothetical protein VNO77_15196 [Canavalia gladiata]|uniref:Uncharacterized protein n=1 Tax=Canavalia gladiata TaxID=3824 RepID=A0AAN9M2G4_CANGL